MRATGDIPVPAQYPLLPEDPSGVPERLDTPPGRAPGRRNSRGPDPLRVAKYSTYINPTPLTRFGCGRRVYISVDRSLTCRRRLRTPVRSFFGPIPQLSTCRRTQSWTGGARSVSGSPSLAVKRISVQEFYRTGSTCSRPHL